MKTITKNYAAKCLRIRVMDVQALVAAGALKERDRRIVEDHRFRNLLASSKQLVRGHIGL